MKIIGERAYPPKVRSCSSEDEKQVKKEGIVMEKAKVKVDVEFDYSGVFTNQNGKYLTYGGSDWGRILSNFNCMAHITCPKGEVKVYMQPVVDAYDFECYELEGVDSRDYLRLVETDTGFETPDGEKVEFPHEAVEYLYDKELCEDEIVWTLKEEIRDEIKNFIDENLEGVMKECGYEEIDPSEEWNG
ncbi:hypothetical protein [Selenomonas sp. FC4001]|uniref:hypothetical protein n=1 Tax=Selenomonas sp. FC4001 TaxID=1408313 RepID=UPI00056500BE|nr:hypothetical protein [Selenomonas sp. FC4001]